MQYGALPATDQTFVAACLLLAGDPAYESARLKAAVAMRRLILRGHSFGAVEEDRLVGFVAWHEISREMARELIARRHLPASPIQPGGEGALLLSAFVAPSRAGAVTFFRRFTAAHPGKIVMAERHLPSGRKRFFWFDRAGMHLGDDL